MLRSVCIYASQLAACIGHNRFKKQSDALETVWQRVAPSSYRGALERNGIKTEEEMLEELVTANETVRSILVSATATEETTSNEAASGYREASCQLADARLEWDERRLVDETLRRTIYTKFGNRQESVALQRIQGIVACQEDETFYKTKVLEVDGVSVFVGGKIDAITPDGSTIVEIKNRINRLFWTVPMYEVLQVQAYLHAVPTAERACLVECLTRDDGTMVTNSVILERDDALWSHNVLPNLQGFVRALVALLGDEALQDAYFKSRRRASFLAHLMSRPI